MILKDDFSLKENLSFWPFFSICPFLSSHIPHFYSHIWELLCFLQKHGWSYLFLLSFNSCTLCISEYNCCLSHRITRVLLSGCCICLNHMNVNLNLADNWLLDGKNEKNQFFIFLVYSLIKFLILQTNTSNLDKVESFFVCLFVPQDLWNSKR